MCSPASFETAYVQRASPTEPIVVTCASWTLKAYWPKTSLVENSTIRSTVSFVASAASSALYVPITFTRIVRTGVEDVALREVEVRMRRELGPREGVAVEVVDRNHLVLVDQLSRERRPDEPGAAGDHDPLALERHAGIVVECLSRDPERSDAVAAVSRRPASSGHVLPGHARAVACPGPPTSSPHLERNAEPRTRV